MKRYSSIAGFLAPAALGLLQVGFLVHAYPAYAGECQLRIVDRSWALRAGIHPSRLNQTITPVGRNYDPTYAEYVYRWMGMDVPSSKVRIIANKSICDRLPEYVGD